MGTLLQDLRYALRRLRRSPGFAAIAVLTLALGIGTSSAIFCAMDNLLLHPMRVPHPGELVRIFSTTQQDQNGLFSYSEFQVIAQRSTALGSVVAIGRRGSIMPRADGTSASLLTNVVSENFFAALGVQPLLGRRFTASDAPLLRTHPGVLLGYNFWMRQFNGDPAVVGRSITLLRGKDHRVQMDIWGVLPASFQETENASDRDLWMPAESWAALGGPEELASHQFRWFNLIGRLAPGASIDQVNSQVAAVSSALQASDPANNRGRGARAESDLSYRLELAGVAAFVVFGIVAGVVLLAIVNVAHLLLARGLARESDIALRLSLGARKWLVARQLLIENLLLSILGLTAGLGLAAAIAVALPHLLVLEPAMLSSYSFPGIHFAFDGRVFLFSGALALVILLLLAVVPLAQLARSGLLSALRTSAATPSQNRSPIARRAAIWLQIGISFALLVSTAVLVRSFLNTRTQALGLTREQVLVAFTQGPDKAMRDDVLSRLRVLPGVRQVAYAIRSPLMPSEGGTAAKVWLPGHPELHDPVEIKYNAVSPGFMSLIGTRLLHGRGFTDADDAGGPPVVIVSQTMARKYWPGRDPLGQVVRLTAFNVGRAGNLDVRIIGIAEDAPINEIGEIPEPYMYLPFHLSDIGDITFVIQTSQNAMSIAQDVRQVLIHIDPLLDPMFITSLPELIRYSAGNYQMMAELVSALGLIGLVLTAVGLYGFLAFRVTQRRREIGIRMALGASRGETVALILRDTARMAVIGLAIGAALALAAARFEAAVLFGVRPLDGPSLIAALGALGIAVAAAAWIPARRAASVDPMEALRTE